jgi:hypothetical protein
VWRPAAGIGLEHGGVDADKFQVLFDGDRFGDERDAGELDNLVIVTIGHVCLAAAGVECS